MKKNTNKDIEHVMDKLMKDASLESPSVDFTSKVMHQVSVTSKSNVTVYKPLIPKNILIALFALTLGWIGYSMFIGETIEINWLEKLNFNKVSSFFSGFKISQTTMYSLLMFAVMLGIQTPILKRYLDKR
ncbi:hypothetical protein NA63_1586 [Flavobacteriaceae bacterium MAR_2010_105]|nr:hypothetical protein NA63_1586 [Flavobacteriaceae bacterium MAR_2010_105]